MNRCLIWICLLLTSLLFPCQQTRAQVIRIQQPIVQQFSAGTTLTVPDRGRALIGGIDSGYIRSRQVGPFRRGSSIGHAYQSSSASVGVYIHDFEAMDRLLLSQGSAALRSRTDPLHPQRHWKEQLLTREHGTASSIRTDATGTATTQNANAVRQAKAQRFFDLGQKAEQKYASPNIAILHYRTAEKYGSPRASARLEQLTQQVADHETARQK